MRSSPTTIMEILLISNYIIEKFKVLLPQVKGSSPSTMMEVPLRSDLIPENAK